MPLVVEQLPLKPAHALLQSEPLLSPLPPGVMTWHAPHATEFTSAKGNKCKKIFLMNTILRPTFGRYDRTDAHRCNSRPCLSRRAKRQTPSGQRLSVLIATGILKL